MGCSSCGQQYQPPTYPSDPLTIDSYPKGSSKGVIKASGNPISHEEIMSSREGGHTPSLPNTPVAGEAGPATKPLENTNEK